MSRHISAFVLGSLVLACARLALAQDTSAKLTFQHDAASTAAVLADVSKAAGVTMQANASVASDVVVIDFKDATLDEAMRQIAAVLHAEWTRNGNGAYTLTRNMGTAAADQKAEQGERAAALARGIAKKFASVKSQGKFDDEAARKLAKANQDMMDSIMNRANGGGVMRVDGSQMEQMSAKSPAARAIATILSQLSTAQLAAVVNGNRVVFSNHPTRMQLPLPSAVNGTLDAFVREQRIYADAQKEARKTDEGRTIVFGGMGDSEAGEGDPRLGLGTALLVVDPGLARNPNVQLLVTDRNGGVLARGSMSLPSDNPETKPTPFTFEGEKPITLSPLATEFAKVLASGNGGAQMGRAVFRVAIASGSDSFEVSGDPMARPPMQTSKELRERILNPEKYEPLAMAPGEGFAAVAGQWGKNFVAYLPDDTLVPMSQLLGPGKTTPSQLLAWAQASSDLDVRTDGDWMTVVPRHQASARTKKVERGALGKALRNLDALGYLKLDDLASFALSQPKQLQMGDFDFAYMRIVNAGFADQVFSRFAFNGGWGMLRFYGTLSPPQRQSLGAGQQISLANLTVQQIDLLADQVFNSFDGPQVIDPSQSQVQNERRMIRFGGLSLEQERTIVLPTGITRAGFISLKVNTNPAVQGVNTHDGTSNLMNPSSIAWARLQQERPEMLAGLGFTPSLPDKFRTASQTNYSFRFDLAPNVSLSRSLQDASLDRNGALLAYEGLPQEFKQQVEETLARLRSSMGRVGTGTPPVRPPSR